MFNEKDMQEKQAAYDACGQANEATSPGGILGVDRSWRPTLRDRLKKQIEHSSQEQHRARKANELYDLLNKNPDVARILELIEDLQA